MTIIASALDFLKNTVIIQRNTRKKDLRLFETMLTKKIPDPRNAKEHYQSLIWKNPTKPLKKSKVITHQPKTVENPNSLVIKSVIIEHPKTSNKLSIRQAEKFFQVVSNSSSYIYWTLREKPFCPFPGIS